MSLPKLVQIVRPKRRVGRGVGSRGGTSGRGTKGQKARAGWRNRSGFEGGQTPLYQRLPKKRGAKKFSSAQRERSVALSVGKLNQYDEGSIVGLAALRQAGFLGRRDRRVKLIGSGELTLKLTVRVHAVTDRAKQLVEQAGGKVELIQ